LADLTRDEVMDFYAQMRQTWANRNGEYDTSRRRYYGDHWDSTNPAQVNRYSLTVNYLKPFVDKSVQLLVGRMPGLQVHPPGVDEEARRLAEQLEGVLYGTWGLNEAPKVLQRTAWDSFVLRRGLIYVWWDPDKEQVRFKNCAPEHFFPEYDGDEIYRCLYVQRRATAALRKQYPAYAEEIHDDTAMQYEYVVGSSIERIAQPGQTTVIDMWTRDGDFYRVMGNAFIAMNMQLPFEKVPYVEFPCFPVSGETEPLNMIDQLVELNQYIDQLVSQNADIIAKYANPTVLDKGSGQAPETIRKAMGAPGAVIPVKRDGNIELLNWQGSVPAINDQMTFVQDALFDLAGKPRSAFGQTVTNQSGIVTNLTLTPTLQSNEFHESIWGMALSELNEWILALWEQNQAGELIQFRGRARLDSGTQRYYEVELTGQDIGGWYKNSVKWPSAVRVDDPVYVQNQLQQLTSDPPALSLYTYLERAGVEDVEAEIDRIQQQLEDPRLHPERLQAAVGAASQIQQAGLPPGMEGFAPDAGLGAEAGLAPDTGLGQAPFAASLEASATPYRDPLVESAKPSGK
jgi:hypothetical protein